MKTLDRPRLLVLAALLAAGIGVARAQDEGKIPADWKCDLRKVLGSDGGQLKPGEAVSEEEDETETHRIREGEGLPKDDEVVTHFERVKLVVARDEAKKTSETQYRYAAWRRTKDGDDEDRSLEGKTVVVRRSGGRRTFVIVGPDGARAQVSDGALAWVRGEHGPKKVSSEDEKKLAQLAPAEPAAPDTEWTGDPKIVSDVLFEAAPIDAERSSVKGKLTSVRREEGAILGKVSLAMRIQLKYVPATTVEWSDGGAIVAKVEKDGALEDASLPRSDEKMSFHMKGKVRLASGQSREVDWKQEKKRKVRASKAPEKLTLAFDPDAEYRWEVQEWATSEEPDATTRVGDRSFVEVEATSSTHVLANGKPTADKKSSLSARVEIEVTAVADGKASERKATVVRFQMSEGDEVDDSLEGKTILLARAPAAGQPAWQVLDAKGRKTAVTQGAKTFVEGELVRPRTRALQLDGLQELLGSEAVTPDKEIAIDPAKAAKKLFGDGIEIDAVKSRASARLEGVHGAAGDREGKLTAKLALRLKSIPGAPGGRFEEPAVCDVVFAFEGSLDRSKTGVGAATVTMDYSGKGNVNGKAGAVVFEPKIATKRTIRSGALPRSDGKPGGKEAD